MLGLSDGDSGRQEISSVIGENLIEISSGMFAYVGSFCIKPQMCAVDRQTDRRISSSHKAHYQLRGAGLNKLLDNRDRLM